MSRWFPFSLFALAGCASVPSQHYDLTGTPVDEVTATERRFAAAFQQIRFQSFVDFAAADSVTASETGYENARAAYAELAARPIPENPPSLEWWPERIEASCAGDIAWSTGPVLRTRGEQVAHSHYFTIWERQAGGSYAWKYDAGVDHGAPDAAFPRGAEPATNSRAYCADLDGQDRAGRQADFKAAQASFQARLRGGAVEAYRKFLAPDGRVSRDGEVPRDGGDEAMTIVRAGPKELQETEFGQRLSASGDLAYSYGKASWRDADGTERKGDYVRVWRGDGGGWKIVFDQRTQAQA